MQVASAAVAAVTTTATDGNSASPAREGWRENESRVASASAGAARAAGSETGTTATPAATSAADQSEDVRLTGGGYAGAQASASPIASHWIAVKSTASAAAATTDGVERARVPIWRAGRAAVAAKAR